MESKRISFGVAFLLLLVPLISLLFGLMKQPVPTESATSVGEAAERYLQQSLPFSRSLRQVRLELSYFSGTREYEGVFLGEERLMKNVSTLQGFYVEENRKAISHFVEEVLEGEIPAYLLLVPTATGIFRQTVPTYTQPINQRNFIDNTYSQLAETISPVDVYSTLLQHQDKYIYYRTEDNLTPLGGYFIYEQIAKRLLGETVPPRNAYDVFYHPTTYYGSLYQAAPFRRVEGDILMGYRHLEDTDHYTITRWEKDTPQVMTQRYLTDAEGMDFYLGGSARRVLIQSSNKEKKKLLLLGDDTALSYLPFLAESYSEILFLHIDRIQTLPPILLEEYQQVLLACSADTYMNTNHLAQLLFAF